jgi:hypothetical protein
MFTDVSEERGVSIFREDRGGSTIFRKAEKHPPNYTAAHPRKVESNLTKLSLVSAHWRRLGMLFG